MRTSTFRMAKQGKVMAYLLLASFCAGGHDAWAGATGIMKVNRLWAGILEDGGVGGFNYYGAWFPADYNCQGPSMEDGPCVTGSSILMATTNWTDPNGKLLAKTVIRPVDVYPTWSVIDPLKNYLRWGYPGVTVDFQPVTYENWATVDPTKMIGTCDQVAYVTTKNALGVEIQRKIFAWSQTYHDNYIVVDAVLTNRSGKTLTDFWVAIHLGHYYWRKAKGQNPPIPTQDQVDANMAWHHYYGARPGDSLRIFYMYHADDPNRAGDQMGGPVASQDGRLQHSDMLFVTILHASGAPFTSPRDDVDDPLQPRVTTVYSEPAAGIEALWGGSDASGRELIYDVLSGQYAPAFSPAMDGVYPGTFHRANNDEQNNPNFSNLGWGFSLSAIWNRSVMSFGPYNFKDGESLHFVWASGFCSLGPEKEKEIGEKWLKGTLQDPPGLPHPQKGFFPERFAFPPDARPIDLIKDRWISTVIDSVHKSASRIKWNFLRNWQVPGAPPPPTFEVTGYGDGVEIKWSDPEAEALPDFDGYRIMRRVGRQDTVFFQQVHRVPGSEKASVHTWKDTNVLFGASYYYYVQAGRKIASTDLNASPGERGKTVWSGRLFAPTTVPVHPPRPSQSELSKIRICPNPYNIKDPLVYDYGWDDDRGVMFFNLPPEVTIKIFTESGDLVKTIHHKPATRTGSLTWDMLTDNQQAISSGVYIIVFQTPQGEISYQKLLVVR